MLSRHYRKKNESLSRRKSERLLDALSTFEQNYLAHQIPLPLAKSDSTQLKLLEEWLNSYKFNELYVDGKGFSI